MYMFLTHLIGCLREVSERLLTGISLQISPLVKGVGKGRSPSPTHMWAFFLQKHRNSLLLFPISTVGEKYFLYMYWTHVTNMGPTFQTWDPTIQTGRGNFLVT